MRLPGRNRGAVRILVTNDDGVHSEGIRGLGVTVAVLDTGVNINHQELRGRIAAGARSMVTNTGVVTDTVGHGTFVADWFGAKRRPRAWSSRQVNTGSSRWHGRRSRTDAR